MSLLKLGAPIGTQSSVKVVKGTKSSRSIEYNKFGSNSLLVSADLKKAY